MLKFYCKITNTCAQATVEAAIMIPVIFLLILLLIQPGIILYDLTVMNSAAAETCRVLSTSNDENISKICEPFARKRLSAIPQQENFHLHNNGCSYEFNFDGNQNSEVVSVSIKNQLQPLPLIAFLSDVMGLLNSNGCFEIEAQSQQTVRPSWVKNSSAGGNPDYWVGAWLE